MRFIVGLYQIKEWRKENRPCRVHGISWLIGLAVCQINRSKIQGVSIQIIECEQLMGWNPALLFSLCILGKSCFKF
jgi:hypothetical protein